MCFSAEASFAGGALITTIGIVSVAKARKRGQLLFASIPLFFGVQQIIEGFLWLALANTQYLSFQKIGANIYLVFAHAIWPLLIPLSVLLMEENRKKIRILRVLTSLGLLLCIYYILCLFIYPVNPQVNCYHILYVSDYPLFISNTALLFYIVATFTPLFIASNRRTKLLGALMAVSCVITIIFYTQFLTSVWCFFAALISFVVIWIIKSPEENKYSEVKV